MIDHPRVAVVIPLYNKSSTVDRAVYSVLKQTMSRFEVVVVDDGSTDDSCERVAKIADGRIRIVSQSNAGPGGARNRGVVESTAPFIAFLDADDAWRPQHLEQALSAFDKEAGTAAYVASYDPGRFAHKQPKHLVNLIGQSGLVQLSDDIPAERLKRFVDAAQTSCVVLRRTVFERYGGFYEKNRCTYAEDTYLFAPIFICESVYCSLAEQVEFHVEDSALGAARSGRHPPRPALIEPEPLRQACKEHPLLLSRLLALYRLLYTQQLARSGRFGDIQKLRRAFPWPERPNIKLVLLERKLELRCMAAKLGYPTRYPEPPLWF